MTLSLDKLECHFTWCPDEGSTKSNIEDVIEKTQVKIEREPHKKAAHLATLAYLHSIKSKVDYAEATKCLDAALTIDEQIRKEGQQEHQVSSEFVIRANMLHLEQKRRRKEPPKPAEMRQKLDELSRLWTDPVNRARVFGVKGVAFDCFGPKKYQEGVKAFAEALKTQPENFNWLYGEAYLRARCGRQTFEKAAEVEQVELWNKARRVGEQKGLTSPTFYANFAEAILHNKDENHGRQCLELAEKAMDLFLNNSIKNKQLHNIVYIICLKVFRHLSWRQFNTKNRRERLLEDAVQTAACLKDAAFYLNLSYETDDNKKAVELLTKGQQVDPGNLWIELRILELRSNLKTPSGLRWDKDKIVATYDSLRDTLSNYNKNESVIEFHKALYLIKQRDTKAAMSSCIAAVEANPSLEQVSKRMKNNFFGLISEQRSDHEEYLAWYADNVTNLDERLDIQFLYQTALSRDAGNEFALEHLGRYYMKKEQLEGAVECFRKLSEENVSKHKLLAESLLKLAAGADLDLLQECLSCGCRDAAPQILGVLQQEKARQDTASRVMTEASTTGGDAQQRVKPLSFRKELYELCAKLELTMKDDSSFTLQETPSEPSAQEQDVKIVKEQISKFLGLDQLTSKTEQNRSVQYPERGSLMRSSRLHMTKLSLKLRMGGESEEKASKLCNKIVAVLKEAKEVLDRSLAVRMNGPGRLFTYPHAFGQMKSQLGGDFKKEFNKLKSESERKKFERESLMKLLKEKKDSLSSEQIRDYLRSETKTLDKNFHQQHSTKEIFDFMASREHRILSREDCWIVRWIYMANNEKHSDEILVAELEEQLRSDCSGDGQCGRTAYDLAHLAAEFAEETWAVFSGGLLTTVNSPAAEAADSADLQGDDGQSASGGQRSINEE